MVNAEGAGVTYPCFWGCGRTVATRMTLCPKCQRELDEERISMPPGEAEGIRNGSLPAAEAQRRRRARERARKRAKHEE